MNGADGGRHGGAQALEMNSKATPGLSNFSFYRLDIFKILPAVVTATTCPIPTMTLSSKSRATMAMAGSLLLSDRPDESDDQLRRESAYRRLQRGFPLQKAQRRAPQSLPSPPTRRGQVCMPSASGRDSHGTTRCRPDSRRYHDARESGDTSSSRARRRRIAAGSVRTAAAQVNIEFAEQTATTRTAEERSRGAPARFVSCARLRRTSATSIFTAHVVD